MTTELKHLQIQKKIASGAFGEIYIAYDTEQNLNVALKIAKRTQHSQLKHEFTVYKKIKSEFFPKVFNFGKILFNNVYSNCLSMELLGGSLEQLFSKCGKRFSLKTVCIISLKMIEKVEILHQKNYVHRDIKPDNFVFDKSNTNLYLIDFGLAKIYRDENTLIHNPIKTGKNLTGTARYASVNTHQGIEQSRRDDLESIGYCLIYFLNGRLPWQGLRGETKQEKYEAIKKKKESLKIWELCANLPHELYMYMFYVRNLGYEDSPNYIYLKGLLNTIIMKNGWRLTDDLDWVK
ncbi:Casein kinase I hhp2 [Nosema bombycis CQ1]|uniref:non-specific serine/threonine protein kinase n=1 Tax=Nosema bombycis (strain CQ1 / CVCC 102059) TaxID=578461 RepID=R0M975_NOSB1|nr:Casein kinase I hhp2 [Nosema bombycis CQ1]|eukprot:EOB14519.1 Casein kinase I hhp2 [Nosema bombycis CQ1]